MTAQLRVNPIACEAHGLCAEMLPERITLDEWGYPIIDAKPVSGSLLELARRAAAACPTAALLVERERRAGGDRHLRQGVAPRSESKTHR
jgi:ferredoxin